VVYASFNYKGVKPAVRCGAHKLEKMVNVRTGTEAKVKEDLSGLKVIAKVNGVPGAAPAAKKAARSETAAAATGKKAVPIRGPCPDENPCNAAVVFDVCGLFGGSCPVGRNVTIPAFSVASVRNLYHDIISGNKLYYLNFHTAA
jgi:hypothetical protein